MEKIANRGERQEGHEKQKSGEVSEEDEGDIYFFFFLSDRLEHEVSVTIVDPAKHDEKGRIELREEYIDALRKAIKAFEEKLNAKVLGYSYTRRDKRHQRGNAHSRTWHMKLHVHPQFMERLLPITAIGNKILDPEPEKYKQSKYEKEWDKIRQALLKDATERTSILLNLLSCIYAVGCSAHSTSAPASRSSPTSATLTPPREPGRTPLPSPPRNPDQGRGEKPYWWQTDSRGTVCSCEKHVCLGNCVNCVRMQAAMLKTENASVLGMKTVHGHAILMVLLVATAGRVRKAELIKLRPGGSRRTMILEGNMRTTLRLAPTIIVYHLQVGVFMLLTLSQLLLRPRAALGVDILLRPGEVSTQAKRALRTTLRGSATIVRPALTGLLQAHTHTHAKTIQSHAARTNALGVMTDLVTPVTPASPGGREVASSRRGFLNQVPRLAGDLCPATGSRCACGVLCMLIH